MRKLCRKQGKDYLTNKLLSVFTIAFIMIYALMIVGRMMERVDLFLKAWAITKIVLSYSPFWL